jgi:ABC-type dipeptide/oligopeptide/nickel transport system ATPase component
MYAGRAVEEGPLATVFAARIYTRGLLASLPSTAADPTPIGGYHPRPHAAERLPVPPRCPLAEAICEVTSPTSNR